MEEHKKNTNENDDTKDFQGMVHKLIETTSSLKNALENVEKSALELGVEAVKIIGKEAIKISENIPEESQKMMVEGITKAAFGAIALFGNILKTTLETTKGSGDHEGQQPAASQERSLPPCEGKVEKPRAHECDGEVCLL
jgi:hypothetical protein